MRRVSKSRRRLKSAITHVAWSGGGAHFIAAVGAEPGDLVLVGDPGSGTVALVDYENDSVATAIEVASR